MPSPGQRVTIDGEIYIVTQMEQTHSAWEGSRTTLTLQRFAAIDIERQVPIPTVTGRIAGGENIQNIPRTGARPAGDIQFGIDVTDDSLDRAIAAVRDAREAERTGNPVDWEEQNFGPQPGSVEEALTEFEELPPPAPRKRRRRLE